MIKTLAFLYQLLFLPHWLLFLSNKNKNVILEDLYNISPKKSSGKAVAFDLTQQLALNKYFRTLFYFRTRGNISNILRVFYPKDNRLTIDINTKLGGGVILAHPYSSIINAKKLVKTYILIN